MDKVNSMLEDGEHISSEDQKEMIIQCIIERIVDELATHGQLAGKKICKALLLGCVSFFVY
ncbi:MAG: hypothetical protein MJA30_22335, partial [Cytophagales bacterium]|nr:hypothetical protein [Cytophagales bacterium]